MPYLLLGVLKHIYILGDALDLEVIALHFVVHRENVEGVTARAPCLEVRKEGMWGDFSVGSLGIPEFLDPCVCNYSEDELCRLPPRCLVTCADGALRFMCRFCARADDDRIVFVD